jgi:type IV secretion system protein VirB4
MRRKTNKDTVPLSGRIKDMSFGKLSTREMHAAAFVPYTRFSDDHTIKTKEGYLLQIIKLEGLPFETVDQTELNQKKTIRAAILKSLSNSRFGLYHHIIRHQIDEHQDGDFENAWCQKLDQAYQEKLSTKRLFINEHYLTIIRRPAQSKIGIFSELIKTLSSKVDQTLQGQYEAESHKLLQEAVSNILTSLEPYKPRVLGIEQSKDGVFSESLSFLSYLINFEARKLRLPLISLSDYLPAKRLSFGRESFEIRGAAPGDIRLGAILSIKDYMNGTGPGMLDGLLRLPHEFIITQSFGFVDRQTSLNAINAASRKMIATEGGAQSLIDDIEHARDELASGQTSFGEHHLSITVHAPTSDALERGLAECNAALINLGLVTAREDINMEPAFWGSLPGNFGYIGRRALISAHNFASFASLHNFPYGQKTGQHWGTAITRLETSSGSPYWFHFHERDVGNFTVIGPTGTGKTVLLTFLMAQAQRLSPHCFYFDKDRGQSSLSKPQAVIIQLSRPGALAVLIPCNYQIPRKTGPF